MSSIDDNRAATILGPTSDLAHLAKTIARFAAARRLVPLYLRLESRKGIIIS